MQAGRVVVMLVLALAACGDSASGPEARFDVPASGAIGWGVAPFPSDLYLGEDGTVDLASLPSASPMWERVREELGTRRGFCGTCPIYFPINGEIDPATLADGVVMIDPSGAKLAVEAEWDATDSMIAVRAHRGVVPTPGQRYIVALTKAVHGTDGSALRAASGFTSARAQTVITPALATLGEAGVAADSVVALAAFTVEDPAVLARDLAARVTAYYAAHGEPAITVTRVWRASDGTLDALMGVPAEDRPGLDVPSVGGAIGTTGVAHSSVSILIKGTFNSVRVITGTGTELGTLMPTAVAGDQVPFVLAIPAGADVTHLPVLVFHHGASGLLGNGVALADMAAKAGAAFLSLETFQHGERCPGATDTSHSLRKDNDALGPDGFFEAPALTIVTRLLAIKGTPAGQETSPAYMLGTLAQMVADSHALLELVHASDLAPLAAADASLAGLAFDRDKVYYVGLSLGTMIGTATLVADDTVKAAAMNVPIAGLVATLTENEAFRVQLELLGLRTLEIPNAEYEPAFQLSMHPLMGFMQWTLYPVEPPALMKALLAKPRDLMWQLAGLDELAGFASGNAVIAAAGVPAVGSFTFAPVTAGTAPLQGRGAYVFPQADHYMAGYNAGASADVPPALPPFQRRPSSLMFANPVAAVHAQLTHFFQTKRLTGTGEIVAP